MLLPDASTAALITRRVQVLRFHPPHSNACLGHPSPRCEPLDASIVGRSRAPSCRPRLRTAVLRGHDRDHRRAGGQPHPSSASRVSDARVERARSHAQGGFGSGVLRSQQRCRRRAIRGAGGGSRPGRGAGSGRRCAIHGARNPGVGSAGRDMEVCPLPRVPASRVALLVRSTGGVSRCGGFRRDGWGFDSPWGRGMWNTHACF